MSHKCGQNCLRKWGRRSECHCCNNRTRSGSGNGAGGPRPTSVFHDRRQIAVSVGAASPLAKEAAIKLGYGGGEIGRFMQGAAAFKAGKPEPVRNTSYKAGYLWARERGLLFADSPEEAAAMMGYKDGGSAMSMFKQGARLRAAGGKRDWLKPDAAGFPLREGYEWADAMFRQFRLKRLPDERFQRREVPAAVRAVQETGRERAQALGYDSVQTANFLRGMTVRKSGRREPIIPSPYKAGYDYEMEMERSLAI